MRAHQIAGLVLLWVSTGMHIAIAASCSDQVSSGDKGVGILAENAPTCPTGGGVGCFSGGVACRFCMAFSTPQSSHLASCKTTASNSSIAPAATPSVIRSAAPTVTPSITTSNDDCTEALTVA